MGMGSWGVRFQEEGREWRLPGLLNADDLVLRDELAIVGRYIEVRRRRDLKVNAGKSKVLLLGGEEGLECEVYVKEYVLEFKYLGFVLDESGTNEAEGSRKVASGWRVTGVIKSLLNARSLQFGCAKVLQESFLVPVLTYGSETVIWRENERSTIRAVQMDNLRGLLGVRRMDKVSSARQLFGVIKVVDKKINKGILRWFGQEGLCRGLCW